MQSLMKLIQGEIIRLPIAVMDSSFTAWRHVPVFAFASVLVLSPPLVLSLLYYLIVCTCFGLVLD